MTTIFRALLLSLVLPAVPSFAQEKAAGKVDTAAKAADKVAAKAEPGDADKKKKKKKKKAEEAAPERPADPVAVPESTTIDPNVLYRVGKLFPRSGSAYHKTKHGDYFDQLYMTVRFERTYNFQNKVVFEPSVRTQRYDPGKWDEDHKMEQGYIEAPLGNRLLLTAGKKTETEGSGFIVTPSDLLNEGRDVFDQVYQKEGVVFTRLRARIGDASSLALGFIPVAGSPTNKGKAWLQASTDVKETDIRLQVTEHELEKTTVGLSIQRFFGDHFELHTDDRYMRRQRDPALSEQAWMAYSQYERADPSSIYLAGSRIVMSNRRTVVAEGLVNQSGLLPGVRDASGKDFKNYFGDLKARRDADTVGGSPADPPSRLLGRHYAFVSYQDDDSLAATHLSANLLMNLDDQSTFSVLSARYTVSPITSVEFNPTFFRGKVDSEFGEMPFAVGYYLIFRGRF